jgi:hypothetical protein
MYALPICLKLLAVEGRPLCHELERAARQFAHEHCRAVNRDHRMVLGVLRMEVGRLVVVEIHRDHDAVEGFCAPDARGKLGLGHPIFHRDPPASPGGE